jgi:hypothetical protein
MTHISHLTNIPTANVLIKGGCIKKCFCSFTKVSETQYTVMVTPNLGGKHSNVGITVAANTFTDVVGNTNTTITQMRSSAISYQ